MRWKQKLFSTERIKRGFLIFPKTINGETRWLEFAAWEQKYFSSYAGGDWCDEQWVA